jgi:DNA-binding response OmpR family regulator
MWPLASHTGSKHTGLPCEVVAVLRSPQDREAVSDCAQAIGWKLKLLETVDQALSVPASEAVALIIVDRDLSEHDWRSSVQSLANTVSTPCVLLASSVVDPYLFQELVKHGGFDVVPKPIQSKELVRLGRLAFRYWRSQHTSMASE